MPPWYAALLAALVQLFYHRLQNLLPTTWSLARP